ncbi:reverse transcriptase domain-containing protein [Tanacetum coccineum]
MFSLTFCLLLYAKCCHGPSSVQYLNQENFGGIQRSASRVSGLDKTVIESLPFFRFSTLKGWRNGLECSICLSNFEDVEILRLLPKRKGYGSAMASRHGNSPKNLNANHTAAGAIGFRAVATSQRDDAKRYMRGYEAYEQFLAMSNQEVGGSGSGIKRTRAYIPREREEAEQRLLDDYYGDDETPPKYLEENFRRRYRMSSTLFAQIVNDITSYDAQPLPDSPLFDDVLSDTAPEAPFIVNGRTYKKGYYLADGIYPTWSSFVKTLSIARDEKTLRFKRVQESARKDIERAFGVLQVRWGIIRQPARALQINMLKRIITFADVAALFGAMA